MSKSVKGPVDFVRSVGRNMIGREEIHYICGFGMG